MKRLQAIIVLQFLITFFAVPAFPLSYQLSFDKDELSVGEIVTVEIWLDTSDYSCSPADQNVPEDGLFGVQLYFQYDSDKIWVAQAYANANGRFDVIAEVEKRLMVFMLKIKCGTDCIGCSGKFGHQSVSSQFVC